MNSQLLKLKIEQLQEKMQEEQDILISYIEELQSKCVHSHVVSNNTTIHTIWVCKLCGGWEYDIYNQFISKLHPNCRNVTDAEIKDLRHKLLRFSDIRGKLDEI